MGNILDADWYLRVDQPQFDRTNNWNISDLVITRQRPQNDLVIGSQLPFWCRQNNTGGTYWGGTTISREGFTPPVQLSGSDFLVNDRLQSSRVARSIIGQAALGTLVQLVRGSQIQVLQEILVDSSGVYRFDNIIVGNGNDGNFGQDYRVLVYPNGQLTSNPEIRTAQFSTTQAIYNLSGNPDRIENTNELVASYQTNNQASIVNNTSPSFTSLVWKYRSPDRTTTGRSLWQTELGCGSK